MAPCQGTFHALAVLALADISVNMRYAGFVRTAEPESGQFAEEGK